MEHGNKNILTNGAHHNELQGSRVQRFCNGQGEGMNDSLEIPKKPDMDKKIEMLEPHRGLGMFLIEQLVDQVEFNQVSGEGHMVRMVLRLTG